MSCRVLLVNPPVYDFAAYDFWVKPYGLLTAAGYLQHKAEIVLFDYLDRSKSNSTSDLWDRGQFPHQKIPRPACLDKIPRYYHRFGTAQEDFQRFLNENGPFDFVLVQTMMTYWYEGVAEVIEDVRKFLPGAKIVLGGVYATLCHEHAEKLDADLVVRGSELSTFWKFMNIAPDMDALPFWQGYDELDVGVMKLTKGCPFKCTYCSVPNVYKRFSTVSLERALAEYDLLCGHGAENIAFYDDALLYKSDKVLEPFLREVIKRKSPVNFHSPNALNARFVTAELANLLVQAGFKTFYLGFESSSRKWQKQTGSKVFSDELAAAVERLKSAGALAENITAYQILGHPAGDAQRAEDSMRFVNSLGIRIMLADFSPIPGTPDGEYCSKWVDMAEPLMHNKTAFPIMVLGWNESNRLKELCRQLNRSLVEN